MRGLACVFMFQTHGYDSWLAPGARTRRLYYWSQLGGTVPAPTFLFLAGFSLAFVTLRLRSKGLNANQIARQTILRGAEVLGLGLLFRLMEYAVAWGWAPWTDLLRVDVLNTIGVAMMLVAGLIWVASVRAPADARSPSSFGKRNAWTGLGASLLIALVSPLLWTTWRPRWLPWPLESYVDGVHTFGAPQAWLFPIFPWAGFAFFGMAVGFVVLSEWARDREARVRMLAGVGGAGLMVAGVAFERFFRLPAWLEPVHDFWHTSLAFFVVRMGMLLVILWMSWVWCARGWGQRGFSPLIQLGQTSLLVYWVHLEFVYGKFSIIPKRVSSAATSTVGLLVIFVAMLLLSMAQTRWKGRLVA
jgi:Heparan-alpha-glucosaminide N-acetyltransferase, catalytic